MSTDQTDRLTALVEELQEEVRRLDDVACKTPRTMYQ